jgi:hypothetical protein
MPVRFDIDPIDILAAGHRSSGPSRDQPISAMRDPGRRAVAEVT